MTSFPNNLVLGDVIKIGSIITVKLDFVLLGCGDQYCTTFLNIKTKQIVKNFHIEWIQIVDEGWQWLGLSRQSGYFGLWFVSSYWLKLFSNHDFTHEFYKDKGKKRPRMANLKEIFPSVYLKKSFFAPGKSVYLKKFRQFW